MSQSVLPLIVCRKYAHQNQTECYFRKKFQLFFCLYSKKKKSKKLSHYQNKHLSSFFTILNKIYFINFKIDWIHKLSTF